MLSPSRRVLRNCIGVLVLFLLAACGNDWLAASPVPPSTRSLSTEAAASSLSTEAAASSLGTEAAARSLSTEAAARRPSATPAIASPGAAPTIASPTAASTIASLNGSTGTASPNPESIFWPTYGWPSSSPEAQGMDSARLAQAVQVAADQNMKLDSLLVIRHGNVVFEQYFPPYTASTRHEMYSVTKSFISTLVGMALDRGLIDNLQHPVLDFFPQLQIQNVDERKRSMKLEDVLTMRSGLTWNEGDPAYNAMVLSPVWMKYVLDAPMSAAPGRVYNYCSGCSHILSGIVQQAVPGGALQFAEENLFKPLGITNYNWERDWQGIPNGGWGLNLTPRDMAKLGYLFMHNGKWAGKQIVSEEWVKKATSQYVDAGGGWGYGYQWWVDRGLGGYAARGRFGQVIYVNPDLDLIVVTTAHADDGGVIFNLIGDEILPAVKK